ncbi:N-acetylmuramidase domain-containing protein [Sphingomonas albertensis]|uniref:N-acetylmuramidase domain-containing protein n=1 Tax=Sphingomonas albertensis TaxID=2762591 RepID=UPI0037D9F76B
MTPTEFQQWLNAHGANILVDSKPGALTRAATRSVFTNTNAPAVTDSEIAAIALRLGCTPKQVRAVAKVESGGAAFDKQGRPKILFERHLFHRLTGGKFSVTSFSNSAGGGYSEDSWEKLTQAACKDADAAFAAASWGRFQVLGMHWKSLGYSSPIDMAYTAVTSEAGHYTMLARYVEANGMKPAIQALSADPETCRAFAKGYNGPAYLQFNYHVKLAEAMK